MLRGHLWAYRNEFSELPALADGDLFDVFSTSRRFVCRAFYQAEGGIAGRALAGHQMDIDADFLRKRLEEAMRFRARLYPESDVYRWVYGESDGLPGLVIDRYGPVVSVQTSCAFYRLRRELLAKLLLRREGIATVVFLGDGGQEVHGAPLGPLELDLDGVRAGAASFKQIDKSLDEASTMLRAGTATTLRRVVLPLLKPALVAALVYSFVRSMTTVSAVIFLVTAENELATTYIIGRVGNGDYGIALAYCTVLIVLMSLATALIQWLVGERQLGRRKTPA